MPKRIKPPRQPSKRLTMFGNHTTTPGGGVGNPTGRVVRKGAGNIISPNRKDLNP